MPLCQSPMVTLGRLSYLAGILPAAVTPLTHTLNQHPTSRPVAACARCPYASCNAPLFQSHLHVIVSGSNKGISPQQPGHTQVRSGQVAPASSARQPDVETTGGVGSVIFSASAIVLVRPGGGLRIRGGNQSSHGVSSGPLHCSGIYIGTFSAQYAVARPTAHTQRSTEGVKPVEKLPDPDGA